ncbi:MAG: GTP cyclohydrolase I FolE [Bauldia sp.]
MDARDTEPKSGTGAGKRPDRPSREEAEEAVRTLIAWAGDDPQREGLLETPDRVVRLYEEFFGGYGQDGRKALGRTFSDVGGYKNVIIVRDITFNSHCEHHMLPMIGKAHIGYYPSERIVGLSKLARVVDVFAARLQTQERLTADIHRAIEATIKPRGLAVMVEAEHQCMTLRGVQKPGAMTITTEFGGVFKDDIAERARFIAMVRSRAE